MTGLEVKGAAYRLFSFSVLVCASASLSLVSEVVFTENSHVFCQGLSQMPTAGSDFLQLSFQIVSLAIFSS